MHLTLNTDYSLRVLIYVARNPDRLVTTQEIVEYYEISKNHVVKIVNKLGKMSLLELKRGRYGGGMSLAKEPKDINVGQVISETEPHMDIVECFDKEKNTCKIAGNCKLTGALRKANSRFIQELTNYTLADLL